MSITLDGSNSSSVGVPNTRTAQTASGTAIDFTGIPAGTKRITLAFSQLSSNSTGDFLVQLGAGGVQTSGYTSTCLNSASSTSTSTIGIVFCGTPAAATAIKGVMTIVLIGSNTWSAAGTASNAGNYAFSGDVTLSGTLDRLRVTTETGTDVFDSGLVNILYE